MVVKDITNRLEEYKKALVDLDELQRLGVDEDSDQYQGLMMFLDQLWPLLTEAEQCTVN